MANKGHHVIASGGKWSVQKSGSARASHKYPTQQEAIDVAREAARSEGTELYIHGRNGRILDRRSYREDKSPAKAS